jgi:excisionase family DNA binding protein
MEPLIILQGITTEELLKQIESIIDRKISEAITAPPQKRSEYLTRKEVSQKLKISLPTLHDWTKLGLLKSYKMGSRVYYRSDEVEHAVEGKNLNSKRLKNYFRHY